MPIKHCGAKTRAGGKCRAPAMANGRCRVHGGSSTGAPKGNANAVTHGFYSDALLPEERQLYERAEVGGVDDEIRLARVKLHRYVRLSGSADVATLVDGALEVIARQSAELDDSGKVKPARREIKAAAPQYAELILRTLDLIRKLEATRVQLALGRKALEEDNNPGDSIDGFEVVEYGDDETEGAAE